MMILREITPFLRCDYKRCRAELMLAICALSKSNGVYTDAEIGNKNALEIQFMNTGNRRGKRNHIEVNIIRV